MIKFSKVLRSLPLAALSVAAQAGAATPEFVDWTSINTTTDIAQGNIGAIDIILSGTPIQSGNVDGTSTIFSDSAFTPSLATSDDVELASYTIASLYTLSFSKSVSDPIFHIADLSTRVTFDGAAVALVSGNSCFTVSGNSIDGGGVSCAGNGTIQLSGTYTSIAFSAVDLIQSPPGGDGFYIQVGVSPVPEPATYALTLAGLFAMAGRVHRRRLARCQN